MYQTNKLTNKKLCTAIYKKSYTSLEKTGNLVTSGPQFFGWLVGGCCCFFKSYRIHSLVTSTIKTN